MTKELLQKLFTYNPETGEFRNKIDRASNARKGGLIKSNHSCGYRRVNVEGNLYYTHRLIWIYLYGRIPTKFVIDHIDGNTSNNKIQNLRCVPISQNQRNRKICTQNTSGQSGVYFRKDTKRWTAQITNNEGKRLSLGCFKSKEEAVKKRIAVEKSLGYHPNHGRI